MFLMYFTEQPMSAYPVDEALKNNGINVLNFSNRFFEPVEGSRLYNERLEEYKLVDEIGFDGLMLNEHHNTPACMQPEVTVWASILAAVTQHVKIVTLGIPLPLWDNPLQVAESFAMIDMISKGRLVSGIVRGGGTEQYAMNVNPVYNRDRLEEAHDLLIKTWTTPGPFRWEGDHYQFRVVNPWATPMQKPHPRIWVPGTSSNETIEWAAVHRYPYMGLGTNPNAQERIMRIYTETAHRVGYEVGPECFGQLIGTHVQDTREKAIEQVIESETIGQGPELSGFGHPVWSGPTGFLAAARRQSLVERANGRAKDVPRMSARRRPGEAALSIEQRIENGILMTGNPDDVIKQIRDVITKTKPGVFIFLAHDAMMTHASVMRSIELLGTKVVPAIREIGDELGLKSPFEANAPVSAQFSDDLDPSRWGSPAAVS